jgi:hypothetical protein
LKEPGFNTEAGTPVQSIWPEKSQRAAEYWQLLWEWKADGFKNTEDMKLERFQTVLYLAHGGSQDLIGVKSLIFILLIA